MGRVDKDLFSSLLLHSVIRGVHSTGVAAITRTDVNVYKKAVPSYDFLELSGANACINSADLGLIGHVRHATLGARNAANAHPFSHGDITLVHNGTLTNKHQLQDAKSFDTDSEAICWNLSIVDEDQYTQVLESLEGAYALIWYNSANECVYIARNNERDLHCFKTQATANSSRTYVLCSEKAMGDWLINRGTSSRNVTDFEIPVGVMYKLNLRTHEVQETQFVPKKPQRFFQHGGKSIHHGTAKTMRFIVDWHDATKIYCSGKDNVNLELVLYRVSQNKVGEVREDDILEVQVSSIVGTNAYAAVNSATKVGRLSSKYAGVVCTECGNKITSDDWQTSNWDLNPDQSIKHRKCPPLRLVKKE